jgi:hypothetical protein
LLTNSDRDQNYKNGRVGEVENRIEGELARYFLGSFQVDSLLHFKIRRYGVYSSTCSKWSPSESVLPHSQENSRRFSSYQSTARPRSTIRSPHVHSRIMLSRHSITCSFIVCIPSRFRSCQKQSHIQQSGTTLTVLKQLHLLLHTVQIQALLYSETSHRFFATLPPTEEAENNRKYPEHSTEEAENYRNRSADSGWTTTVAAARALGVTSRTIRHYIDWGDLDGKLKEGTDKRIWLVSIDSLNTLRAKRRTGK